MSLSPMPSLLPVVPQCADSDAQVPLKISSTDTMGREGVAVPRSRSCKHQEPHRNEQRRKLRTRKPDKTSRKETRDFKERHLATTASETASLKAGG